MTKRTKKTCGHFRTYWCKVTSPEGAWSIRYCQTCGVAVESRQGLSIADYAQKAEAIARRKESAGVDRPSVSP